MSWSDAHRYYRTLRAVETELDRRLDGVVEWHAQYADIYGTPERLLAALRTRWTTMVEAQADLDLDPARQPSIEWCELAEAHPGLVRVLGYVPADDRVMVGAA